HRQPAAMFVGITMRCQFHWVRTSIMLILAFHKAGPASRGDPALASSGPSQALLQKQAQRCRQILKISIIDFYLPACVDQVNGGYLESLKENKFSPTGEKFLTLQARQLWFFSTLAAASIEKAAALAASTSGFDFLESKFRDRTH